MKELSTKDLEFMVKVLCDVASIEFCCANPDKQQDEKATPGYWYEWALKCLGRTKDE